MRLFAIPNTVIAWNFSAMIVSFEVGEPSWGTSKVSRMKRTLTNLYNARPTWRDLAHGKLDEAVFAAYGWQPDLSDEEFLEKLLTLNLERTKASCRCEECVEAQ